jgi:hypothetical protein
MSVLAAIAVLGLVLVLSLIGTCALAQWLADRQ